MRDNDFATSRNRQFQNELIAWITQHRPPKKMDLLLVSNLAKIVDESDGFLFSQSKFLGMTDENRFILECQRHG